MLSKKEEEFLIWWPNNKQKEQNPIRQVILGLPIGLFIGIAIIIALESGWYERANMVAHSKGSPVILIIAICIISTFIAVFYKRYKCEMYEQQYQELMAKKNNINSNAAKTANK